jgi:hypothetical protein
MKFFYGQGQNFLFYYEYLLLIITPLSLMSTTEEILDRKVAAPV